MKRSLIVLVLLCIAAMSSAQLGDIVKTRIAFDKDRYARGVLLTGSTVTRDAQGTGNIVTVPGRVDFYWSSDIRGMTFIGSLYTNNGQTSLANLGFHIPTNPLDDNVYLYARWVATVPSFLGEPTYVSKRIPIGT